MVIYGDVILSVRVLLRGLFVLLSRLFYNYYYYNPTRARASSCSVPSLVCTQGVVTGLKHFSLLEISTGIETVSALGKHVFCSHWVGASLFNDASNAALCGCCSIYVNNHSGAAYYWQRWQKYVLFTFEYILVPVFFFLTFTWVDVWILHTLVKAEVLILHFTYAQNVSIIHLRTIKVQPF